MLKSLLDEKREPSTEEQSKAKREQSEAKREQCTKLNEELGRDTSLYRLRECNARTIQMSNTYLNEMLA